MIWHFLLLLPECGTHFRVPDASAGMAWVGNSLQCPLWALLFQCGENSSSLWSCLSQQELGFLVLHCFWEHWSSSTAPHVLQKSGFQGGTGIHVPSAASCPFKQGKQSNLRIKTSSAFHLLDHAPGVLWEGIKGKEIKYIY